MQPVNGVIHYTTNEVAEKLGVRPGTVRLWRTNADPTKPQAIKIGNSVLYRADDVDEFAMAYGA